MASFFVLLLETAWAKASITTFVKSIEKVAIIAIPIIRFNLDILCSINNTITKLIYYKLKLIFTVK